MNTFGKLLKAFRTKNVADKRMFKDDRDMPANVYSKRLSIREYAKKFHVIHYVFKYRLFFPILIIAQKILGKCLQTEVPEEWHNKNLIIFEKAFNRALDEWCEFYISSTEPSVKKRAKYLAAKNSAKTKDLVFMKDVLLTVLTWDTAYKELFNVILFNIAQDMTKAYPKGRVNHVFYNNKSPLDVNYMVLGKIIQEGSENVNLSKLSEEHVGKK